MSQYYGVLFIIVLVGVSGAIAYIGDLVGRKMGRKRLTLFGLRPRYTAIVISVISGMLITILTLTLAMALSENVRIGFISVGQLRTETRNLRSQERSLKTEVTNLSRGIKDGQEKLGKTQTELTQAQEGLKKVHFELSKTEGDLNSAKLALGRTSKRLAESEGALRRSESTKLYTAQVFANIAYYQQVLFSANQPLNRVVVDSGQTVPMIRKQLEGFVERLNADVLKAGAKPNKGQSQALLIAQEYVPDSKTGEGGWVPQSKVLDDLARFLKANAASHGLVVEALALRNSTRGEPVLAYLLIFTNELVFRKGTSLGTLGLKGYDGSVGDEDAEARWEADTYAYLVHFMRETVGPRGKGKVMPLMDPSAPEGYSPSKSSVGNMPPSELFDAMWKVRKAHGTARVTALAKEDTWTSGPLEVELKVEPR